MSMLLAHQQRVVDEKAELDAKRNSLQEFMLSTVFGTLSDAERKDLIQQYDVMTQYSNILESRIGRF